MAVTPSTTNMPLAVSRCRRNSASVRAVNGSRRGSFGSSTVVTLATAVIVVDALTASRSGASIIELMFVKEACPTGEEVQWQASLFAFDEPSVDASFAGLQRHWLDDDSWIDHQPRWLSGSDTVFASLVVTLPWRQRVVRMYDRLVDEPRLTWWWSAAEDPREAVPLPVMTDAAAAVSGRYGRAFDSIGVNFYRDGHDSVAWHADRIRFTHVDPIVVIVSVGSPRPFLVRPAGGGPSRSFLLGHGDLFVMGGHCQHQWEHTVPKVASAGPRISITYRHGSPEPTGVHHRRATVGHPPPDGARAIVKEAQRLRRERLPPSVWGSGA